MTHVSLFSGIGGIDLAAERAGFETIAQVEKDDYATKVLEKHWPDVHRVRDIKDFPDQNYGAVTLISGGFPCQDIARPNQFKKAGINGNRSGLWKDMARIIAEIRPKFVLVENVPALLDRGIGVVLRDLSESGYDAEWDCISAWQVGAPQGRDRLFIVAYPHGFRYDAPSIFDRANKIGERTTEKKWEKIKYHEQYLFEQIFGYRLPMYPEPLQVDHDVSRRLDRIRCLGNAVVPTQVYPILQAIAEIEGKKLIQELPTKGG